MLTLLIGGGNRQTWRQVAPHGGSKAMLPTNPWCVGIPGGVNGPVVLDFATSKIAGGWIYAAQSAGALLPEGCIIDRHGNPSRKPQDYFDGGAILPSGEHKGYALALMGELIGEAMLGPVSRECNWLLIGIDTRRFNAPGEMQRIAEEILAEMRDCPLPRGLIVSISRENVKPNTGNLPVASLPCPKQHGIRSPRSSVTSRMIRAGLSAQFCR